MVIQMNTINCLKSEKELFSYPKHSHNNWEITLQLSGTAHTKMSEKEYNIVKGNVMVIPPGVIHQGTSQTPFSDIYLQAKNLDFSDITITFDEDGNIRNLIHLLHKVMTEKNYNYENIADNLTKTICSFIKMQLKYSEKYTFVEKFRKSVYENLSNPNFNITKEIKKSGYNTDYFRRCFKSVYNKTPKEYLTQLRIEQAKEMLIHESYISVNHVAESCGFADSFYFCTYFKKKVGISPLQFRKSNVSNFI